MKTLHKALNIAVVILVASLFVPSLVFSQTFGKNKVNYKHYRFSYIESEHFEIYYADGSKKIALFTATAAEEALISIQKALDHTLTDRIPLIVYNSHNRFLETNVIYELLTEGVGGFTEFAQNRVVIPYEGSYGKFRHVIHHELTHAVMFDMLTGGKGLPALISGQATQPPLWVAEGLAEYLSMGWDMEADNFMRDAAISGYLPDIDSIYGGLFAYKGGQSIFRFIAQEYGDRKITEFLSNLKTSKSVEAALKSSIGITVDELSEAWSKELKKEHWPELSKRKGPEEISKKLTDHKKEGAFLNIGPSFSPKGGKIAFVSTRRDYSDIYLMSAIDGQILDLLVEGEKKDDFESLLLLRPGITWSPDGTKISFAAKSGDRNTLYVLEVGKKDVVKKLKLELDGMFSPTWSPDGDRIAVAGLKDGESDIYVVSLKDDGIKRITHDPYDDQHLEWSPDGKYIAFSSDRPDETIKHTDQIWEDGFKYGHYDIFTITPDGSKMRRITSDPSNDLSPTWGPESDKIAFVSYRTGIGNIFIAHLDTSVIYPITDLVTSVKDLDWSPDGDRIAFSSFHKGGYDIYTLKSPLSQKKDMAEIEPTLFIRDASRDVSENQNKEQKTDQQRIALKDTLQSDPEATSQELAAEVLHLQTHQDTIVGTRGTYRPFPARLEEKDYKLNFSPELFVANARFSSFFGFSGLTQISFADVLGNHRLIFASDLNFSIKNSDLFASYIYLPKRTDYGASLFHTRTFFFSNDGNLIADRVYGLSFIASRPSSKFTRFELGGTFIAIDREKLSRRIFRNFRSGFFAGTTRGITSEKIESKKAFVVEANLVNDTVLHGRLGPIDGSRSILKLEYSPPIQKDGLRFTSISFDWRKYYRVLKNYNFVLRFSGGKSVGKTPQQFFLGGVTNEINPVFAEGSEIADLEIEGIFFSSFEGPLRGTDFLEFVGDGFGLANIEFRFPLVQQLSLGWPLPFSFRNIGGALFFDIGGVLDKDRSFSPFRSENGLPVLEDLIAGYGVGSRTDLGFFVLKFDVGWKTDLNTTSLPRYYFSVGRDF